MTRSAGASPRSERGRKWVATLIVLLLVTIVLGGAYAVTYAPEHSARLQAERVNGTTAVDIGDPALASVTPAAAWSVRPVVEPLFGGLALFKNPAVMFGTSPGVRVESPDGALAVEFTALGEQNVDTLFELGGAEGETPREETLASGSTLRSVRTGARGSDDPTGMLIVLTAGSAELLARVTLDPGAPHGLDDYLPALSDLCESVAR